MEPNGTNESRCASVILCRMGCGFYGSMSCDGLCSKCYKDRAKTRRENSMSDKMNNQSQSATSSSEPPTNNNRGHDINQSQFTIAMSSDVEAADTSSSEVAAAMTHMHITNQTSASSDGSTHQQATSSEASDSDGSSRDGSESSNIVQYSAAGSLHEPAVTSQELNNARVTPDSDNVEGAVGISGTSGDNSSTCSSSSAKSKKNRCGTCNKKVGLTGFPCRCGGLFCSLHRYSDTHTCTFNYKEQAQEDIRKNNPVVVGEKIKKI